METYNTEEPFKLTKHLPVINFTSLFFIPKVRNFLQSN